MQGRWTYELPFGKGKTLLHDAPGVVDRIVGGWEVAGFLTILSPRPFTVWSGNYTMSSTVSSTADCSGCSHDMGKVFDDSASGYKWFFNQSQIGMFSNPAAGSMGNTGRNAFNQPWRRDVDRSLIKRIHITERHKIEFRTEATNLTNTGVVRIPHDLNCQQHIGAHQGFHDQQFAQDPTAAEVRFLRTTGALHG